MKQLFSVVIWDLTPVTDDLSGLGTSLFAAGAIAITFALVLFGLKQAVKFILRQFKETAEGGGYDWRADVPATPDSWKGSREGYENDWVSRQMEWGYDRDVGGYWDDRTGRHYETAHPDPDNVNDERNYGDDEVGPANQ
jgi:hypothetical protein